MELTKLVLLFFLISLSKCRREQPSKLIKWFPLDIIPKHNALNNLEQCFCNIQKATSVPISEKLKHDGENLKRLVVYLYKNPTSNEINLYVPNNEKQLMIPDLSFDEGDRLEASSSDNLETIFTKFSDLVTVHSHSHDISKLIRPIKIIPYQDKILYENKLPMKPTNIRIPKPSESEYDNIEQHNLNIDLNPDRQPYIEFQADEPNTPINVISVNINRKKANPNVNRITPYRGNLIRITGPNRDRLNTNLDSNQNPDDVMVDYPEDGEIEESMSPDDTDIVKDDTEDDINKPDPEVIIAENDFVKMPLELTDEMTDIFDDSTPKTVRKTLNHIIKGKERYIAREIQKNPIIETHTVPTELLSTESSPIISADINIQTPLDTDMSDETAPVVENENTLQPDIPIDDNQQPIENENQYRPALEGDTDNNIVLPNTDSTYDMTDYNNQPPNIIIGSSTKPNREEITPISIKVQKNLLDTLVPNRQFVKPIDYIKNDVYNNQRLIPGDLSIFSVHPETLIKKYQGINGIDFQDTFDNWFDRQIKRVRFQNSRASNSIDVYTLKYLIEKTLHEKGMFVTDKGYIIDSDGHILRTANLALRPILIGNSVEYKNLLLGKFSTFNLPMDMPYLEAVLITSIDPPKILGIIPLGKTYLPKTIQKPLPYYVDNGIIGNGCGGVCNMRDMLLPSLNSRRHRGQAYVGLKPIKTRVTHNHQHKNRIRPYSRRIFPFDPINTFIDKLYRVPLRETKVVRRPSTYVVNYETGPIIAREPVIKYPIAVSEVTPGFRIIGGNPATSSGTPVSSKGRSGYDSMENSLPAIDNNI